MHKSAFRPTLFHGAVRAGAVALAATMALQACSSSRLSDVDAAPSVDLALRGDAGLPADAGPPPDAGPPAEDAALPVDAGPAGDLGRTAGLVTCGGAECVVPDEACRATCTVDGAPSPACVPIPEVGRFGTCPAEETFPIVVANCDGPEDCPGEACLVLSGSLGNYPQCRCDATPDGGCVSPFSTALCHSLADCGPLATACEVNAGLLEGFYRTCVE